MQSPADVLPFRPFRVVSQVTGRRRAAAGFACPIGRRTMTVGGLKALMAAVLCAGLSSSAMSAGEPPDPVRAIEQAFRGGDAARAFERLEQALATRPEQARLRFLQGVMLFESGRQAEAEAVYERLTQDYPELPEPYNNLAVLQAAQGRLDSARELLETALRNDPGYRTARENLGDVLVRLAARAYEQAGSGPVTDLALQRKLQRLRELLAH